VSLPARSGISAQQRAARSIGFAARSQPSRRGHGAVQFQVLLNARGLTTGSLLSAIRLW